MRPSARFAAAFAACAFAIASIAGQSPAPARAQAVSPLDFAVGSLADVRLGIAIAAIAELVDAPALLARPSSQSFVDDAFARVLLSTNDPVVRGRVPRYRDDLARAATSGFDRLAANRDVTALAKDVLRALPDPRNRLFAVGLLAEQCAYNARTLRSPSADAELRRALGSVTVADTLVPGLRDMRARVASIGRGRWADVTSASLAIVAAIAGPNSAPPFAETNGVWLVLLRSRPVQPEALRHGTPHLWFDVVRFDGTHHTLGAYPSGDGNFAHDAPKLVCGFDREGDSASERAVPVVPAPGTTDAQLADELAARCIASAKGRWTYRVRDASDARFVVDLLVNTVSDGAAVMREIR